MKKLLIVLGVYLVLWATTIYRTENLFSYPLQGEAFTDIAFKDFNFSGKRLTFRVDSLTLLRANMGRDDGYEIDMHFRQGKLLIGHNPEDLTDLSFEKMLQEIPEPARYVFWLDLKNLEEANRTEILKHLAYLIDTYSLKDRLIVESKNVSVLTTMRGRGFYTSYYLPFPNRYRPSQKDAIMLAETLRKYPVDAVSSFGSLSPFMEHYFPHVPFLAWWWGPLRDFFYTGWIDERLMEKSQVKVLITKNWSNHEFAEAVIASWYGLRRSMKTQ